MKRWLGRATAYYVATMAANATIYVLWKREKRKANELIDRAIAKTIADREAEERQGQQAKETSTQILAFARPELARLNIDDENWYVRVCTGDDHPDVVPVPVQFGPFPFATLVPVKLDGTLPSPWGPLRYGVNREKGIGAVSIMDSQIGDLLQTANAPSE